MPGGQGGDKASHGGFKSREKLAGLLHFAQRGGLAEVGVVRELVDVSADAADLEGGGGKGFFKRFGQDDAAVQIGKGGFAEKGGWFVAGVFRSSV